MTESAKPRLMFTGERFVPGEGGARIAYEHYHRYYLTQRLASGKVVLDLGCGAGYGADLLARTAARVTGLDLSEESIAHARAHYVRSNLEFVVGDCRKTGLAGEQFDLIVCFEMVEHIAEHQQLLSETRRLLRPDGVLIISSPDKREYSDAVNYENPFHVKELYAEEFQVLLERNFTKVRLFSQKLCLGSVLLSASPGEPDCPEGAEVFEVEATPENTFQPRDAGASGAKYLIGVCSNTTHHDAIRNLRLSVWNDTSERIAGELETAFRAAQDSIQQLNGQKLVLEEMLADRDRQVQERDRMLSEKAVQISGLKEKLLSRDVEFVSKNEQILNRDLEITGLRTELEELRRFEAKLKKTIAWRMYAVLPGPFRRWVRRIFSRGDAAVPSSRPDA